MTQAQPDIVPWLLNRAEDEDISAKLHAHNEEQYQRHFERARNLRAAAVTIERLRAERDGERAAREKTERALRSKDEAMDVLFKRLHSAGVDCSDLIP